MTPWVLVLDVGAAGPRVAVKDLVDVAGTPTTAGCRAVAARAAPADRDAACLTGLRAAVGSGRARLAGKAGLHELALGPTGANPWYGTPPNPLGSRLVPGGSSSGSASAVATGAADWAVGTDSGGSVRIPAACCGVVGLKTTTGRIPLDGVWPLAPTLDTVGPMAPDVAGVIAGMAVLDPSFDPRRAMGAGTPSGSVRVGRVRVDLPVDDVVDAAVDHAIAAVADSLEDRPLPGWRHAARAGLDLLGAEASALHGHLPRDHPGEVGDDVVAALAHAAGVGHQRRRDALALAPGWRRTLERALDGVDVLALPTIGIPPPSIDDQVALGRLGAAWTIPVNLAGLPAIALPVPTAGGPPASLQLIGRAGKEEALCRVALAFETTLARGWS